MSSGECRLVGIVEAVLQRRRGAGDVGLGNARFDLGIVHVRVVVRRTPLSCRPWWVADDNADVEVLLAGAAARVVGEDRGDQVVPTVHRERIGEADAIEWLVRAVGLPLECRLDVDRRDVVREEHDLVRVQLRRPSVAAVLTDDLVPGEYARLHEPRDERAGARERVENVDAVLGEAGVELFAQHVLDRPEYEIHDFYRGVDDPEALGHTRKKHFGRTCRRARRRFSGEPRPCQYPARADGPIRKRHRGSLPRGRGRRAPARRGRSASLGSRYCGAPRPHRRRGRRKPAW